MEHPLSYEPGLRAAGSAQRPLVLTIPGLDGSCPRHWQSRWERTDAAIERVDMGDWSHPNRNLWVNRLNLAVHRASRPLVLVAHSLGCLAVAWWVLYEQPAWCERVVGALLVAPPDVDGAVADERLLPFAPTPLLPLPFPSILVASRDDPYARFERLQRLAGFWGSDFVDAGARGHLNAQSRLGAWGEGRALLGRLADDGAAGRPAARQIVAPPEYSLSS